MHALPPSLWHSAGLSSTPSAVSPPHHCHTCRTGTHISGLATDTGCFQHCKVSGMHVSDEHDSQPACNTCERAHQSMSSSRVPKLEAAATQRDARGTARGQRKMGNPTATVATHLDTETHKTRHMRTYSPTIHTQQQQLTTARMQTPPGSKPPTHTFRPRHKAPTRRRLPAKASTKLCQMSRPPPKPGAKHNKGPNTETTSHKTGMHCTVLLQLGLPAHSWLLPGRAPHATYVCARPTQLVQLLPGGAYVQRSAAWWCNTSAGCARIVCYCQDAHNPQPCPQRRLQLRQPGGFAAKTPQNRLKNTTKNALWRGAVVAAANEGERGDRGQQTREHAVCATAAPSTGWQTLAGSGKEQQHMPPLESAAAEPATY